ncbi:hypothetical protein V1477_016281 [Vespula maculifrons]|uniref:Uncharacterized protein n=1 Tax=Vespula maculifrons TaxID=7453 RepID=A0ABD2BCT5_VESMC
MKIFKPLGNFENLSPRVDLEIFASVGDFENLSPRVDLEIFESFGDCESISTSGLRNLLRMPNSSEVSVCSRINSVTCITEEDLDQLRCRPTSFSTNYKSSTLNFDLNRGPVFWSRRRTSKVLLGHEAKKRLCAEEAPTNCGSRGQLLDYRNMAIVRTIENTLNKSVHGNETRTLKYFKHILEGYLTGFQHDRSCLEMSEADGVDGGAICKRGFIHLQFAEKPEAPEAERHLGSWILE